ncbi:DUF2089 domain-containing protein [Sporosarcina sp. BI001-red]|uniref:DUF2089 domain-containing protein n=1 Tax=Sporosarcina sp. BI001-red TaxID=2282866 RepID=UPI000E269004|nr:DUF2089 domain-containing protein [Sporosarcina sp. BI001-red]REB11018.1 DUF2089 domain-containing protein [Sporosarcina sp. BI001-red]
MAYPIITNCPVCSEVLKITKLQCTHCDTTIENEFELSKFATLSSEHLSFIEIFLKSRGNIKEVEKELGVSYPTVRGKLNEIVSALGATEKKNDLDDKNVIDMLGRGEISLDEAIKTIKGN